MQRIAGRLAGFFAARGYLDPEQREVAAYGFDLLIYTLLSTLGLLLAGAVLGNPGQFALKLRLPVVADGALNVMNARTADFLFGRGCGRVTLSPELNLSEVREVIRAGGSFELIAYGRVQLMLLSHCTDCVKRGVSETDTACERCAAGSGAQGLPLIDRKGFAFPERRLRLPHGCMLRLYNSVPTDLSRYMERLRSLPLSFRL